MMGPAGNTIPTPKTSSKHESVALKSCVSCVFVRWVPCVFKWSSTWLKFHCFFNSQQFMCCGMPQTRPEMDSDDDCEWGERPQQRPICQCVAHSHNTPSAHYSPLKKCLGCSLASDLSHQPQNTIFCSQSPPHKRMMHHFCRGHFLWSQFDICGAFTGANLACL